MKKEHMVLEQQYVAKDFTSVPDCTWNCIGSERDGKIEGMTRFKLTPCGIQAYGDLRVACEKCIGGISDPKNDF